MSEKQKKQNVLGIIAEYNPFHNGHLYHLTESKRKCNAKYVVAIISGNFTQRGDASIVNKFEKAKMAIENGIDMAIELPTLYSISSAENFANGAIKILNELNFVTHISFGSESGNINQLNNIASILTDEPEEFSKLLKEELRKGSSFPVARQNAIVNHRRFKLHRFKIWGGQDGGQTEFRICAVVGKIQVVDYATDGKIEIMSNRMESDVLLVRTKGFGKVYVTAYYYDDFTAQWYKDSTECIVQVVSPLFPGNVPSNPDNGYYELGGLDRNYRLNLDIGQTKTCNVIIKDNRGITLGNLQDFTVYNIEYDSDYISVKQDGTSFNITGLKEGSSYLYIQFQAKDFFGNYKRYYGVWANVEVYEHYSPPFTPGQDDPSNLEGDKEIPEEIKFEFSSYSIKQGDSITLKLFKKVDGEFVEVTDIDNYRFESSNTDVAYFLTQHSAYLKTSESGQVTITVSRSFAKDNINIDKTLTASASVYVSRQFK